MIMAVEPSADNLATSNDENILNLKRRRHLNLFLIKVSVIVGSGGLIFGYDIGVIAGTLDQLQNSYAIPTFKTNILCKIGLICQISSKALWFLSFMLVPYSAA